MVDLVGLALALMSKLASMITFTSGSLANGSHLAEFAQNLAFIPLCVSSPANYVYRLLRLPTLAPDIITAIINGNLTVFGTFVVWAMGGLIYVWPRVCGRELWSFKSIPCRPSIGSLAAVRRQSARAPWWRYRR